MKSNWPEELVQKARQVRAAVFDVDGVMTDGRLYYAEDGGEFKAFHTRDGLGLKGLINQGIAVGVITARQSNIVSRRMQELGIQH
ncbi:MAG: phenylphosphate carboxylase subunit delta, partial [Wenzhouxiangella sp.]